MAGKKPSPRKRAAKAAPRKPAAKSAAKKRAPAASTKRPAGSRSRGSRTKPRNPKPRLSRAARIRRIRRWLIVLVGLGVVLVAVYFFWFRDSSLVAVNTVRIEGIADQNADPALRPAIDSAAREMTTLHVQTELLEQAVKPFPSVRSVSAEADFPNTLKVDVAMRKPGAVVTVGSEEIGVAADGTLVPDVDVSSSDLPTFEASEDPVDGRLVGEDLSIAQVLGAAPQALRPLIETGQIDDHGVTVVVNGGIELRFGTASKAAQKWKSAAAVLADPELTTLDYVDLSSPTRPAVGGSGHTLPSG